VELSPIPRILWRRRVLVGLGVLVAVVSALLSHRHHGDAYRAVTTVLVDTPRSQLADVLPRGGETIAPRATLLGELLAREEAVSAIAERAGVPDGELAVSGPSAAGPIAVSRLSEDAVDAVRPRGPYTVFVWGDPAISALTIVAQAPDPAQAERLASAAAGSLQALAERAEPQRPGNAVVEVLGAPQATPVAAGRGTRGAALLGLGIWALWCLGIVVLDASRRRLSRAGGPASRRAASSPSPS
jgi:hypothetical protein